MKHFALLLSLALGGCGHGQLTLPPYVQKKVCSDRALAYLSAPHKNVVVGHKRDMPHYTEEQITARMVGVKAEAMECYRADVARTKKTLQSFNMCLVVGYDLSGKMEFFDFSTKEIEVTAEFHRCLAKLKQHPQLAA